MGWIIYGKWLSCPPTEAQLKRITVDQIYKLAKGKRSIKNPLKKLLVNYVIDVFTER